MPLLPALLIATSAVGWQGAAAQCYRKELAPEHRPSYVKSAHPHTYTTPEQLPSEFTWQNVNGRSMITPLLNQHIPVYCGSCWLHASTATLNDRLKIARNGTAPDIMLARQVILNCGTNESSDHYAGSCQGGTSPGVYNYMMKEGLPDETCQQYDATDHECSPYRTCMNCDSKRSLKPGMPMCYPVTRYGKFFVEEWGPVPKISVHAMKAEIFRRGPITCSVDAGRLEQGRYRRGEIIADTYRVWDGKAWETDHEISVVGWGLEGSTEYWVVRNSWGRYWGEDGFVKVATGKNAMSIETECYWAVIMADPVVAEYGPSDSDRLFPSADVPSFNEEGYLHVFESRFRTEDVATFVRRLTESHGWTVIDAHALADLAAYPPAKFSDLEATVAAATCASAGPLACSTGLLGNGSRITPGTVFMGGLAVVALLGVVVCILGRRRLRREPRIVNPSALSSAGTEIAAA